MPCCVYQRPALDLQGRTTITPCNFLEVGCYSVCGALLRDFSSVWCYSRLLARPNKVKLGVIEVNGAPFPLVKMDFSAIFQKKILNIFIAGF